MNDLVRSGGTQLVDRPQYGRYRSLRTAAGQQIRRVLNGPGQLLQVGGPGEHAAGSRGDSFYCQRRIQLGDHVGEDCQRIPVITVTTLATARPSLPVEGDDDPLLVAGGTPPGPGPQTVQYHSSPRR
jgi:hypothetical protein